MTHSSTFRAASAFLVSLAGTFFKRLGWMPGTTPPLEKVAFCSSLLSSESFLIAKLMWRGVIRLCLLSVASAPLK